jgi:hypothetical protein
MEMLQQSYGTIHFPVQTRKSGLMHRFINWCGEQQKNRLAWLAIIIAGHSCIITPITLLFVMLSGNNFVVWPWIIAAIGMPLVSNLAALPTKITIPVFFLSLLIDLAVIVYCMVIAFNIP